MLQRRRDQPKPEPIPLLILVGKLARNAILPPAPLLGQAAVRRNQ